MSDQLLLSPSLIALLPAFLQLIERLSEVLKFLGKDFVFQALQADDRKAVKAFFEGEPGKERFKAVAGIFEFEETASDIIKRFVCFSISIYFMAVQRSGDLLSLKGWPVAGLALVVILLSVFIIRLAAGKIKIAAEGALRLWSGFSWVIFFALLAFEAAEHAG